MEPPKPLESRNVSCVGYHDLDRRPGFKIALQTVGDRWYLYLSHLWHSGWTILDVTDPYDPALVRFVEGPDNTATFQVQVADGVMVTSLEEPIFKGWGPIGDPMDPAKPNEEGAIFWDVATDPTDPTELGRWETGGGGTHRNHYDGGAYAYMTANLPETQGYCLVILDISDPSQPVEVSRWWHDDQYPAAESVIPESRYMHGPAYPVEDRLYVSYGPLGMIILDVSDRTAPEFVGQVEFGDLGSFIDTHSAVPVPNSDYVVVNSEAILEGTPIEPDGEPLSYTFLVDVSEEGMPGYDFRTPHGPRIISWFPRPTPESHLPYDSYYDKGGKFGPHNQHHYQYQAEHMALTDIWPMTWFIAGLRLFDISNPLEPREVGHYVPEGPDDPVNDMRPGAAPVAQFEDLLVDSRGYIYCTDANHGLFVLESPLIG